MSKAGDGFALNGNRVLVNLPMKSLAKSNDVAVRNRAGGLCGWIGIEPESHAIEEMKTGEINEPGPAWLFFRSEEDCGREDAPKPIDHALIMRPILWQVKEIEHLGGRAKMDCPVFLLKGEGRNPDGDQAVLSKWQTIVRMRGDVQEKLATMTCMHQLGFGRSPQWEPAKHKWTGVEGQWLLTILALFVNKLDGIELFELPFRDTENACGALRTISDRQKTVALFVRWLHAGCIVVPEYESRVRMRATVSD